MACTALSRPARSDGPSADRPTRAHITAATVTSTHTGTLRAPTPNALAVCASSGMDSTFPSTTPPRQPMMAGTETWPAYAATTWPGVKPMLLRMPIRR